MTYEDYINSIHNPNYFSVADGYSLINDAMRKPVKKIIEDNMEFFKGLNNIDEVCSYGFSYSMVDEPYISMICKIIPHNAKWSINSYPSEKKIRYKEVIKRCRYHGQISVFL